MEKNLDLKGRWRHRTVAFRVSEEEAKMIDVQVRLSGLTKQDYIGMLYEIDENDRIFRITKSYLHHEMDRGAKAAGVKRIRVHGLRHSAISLLIEMGFSALAIADRVGHESVDITYRYAHLFPTVQTEMAEKLDLERMGKDETDGEES